MSDAARSFPAPSTDETDPNSPATTNTGEQAVDLSSAAVRQGPRPIGMNNSEPRRILLITDDSVFGRQVITALERLSYQASMLHTSDPSAAIARCGMEQPHLVMLNVDALSLGGLGLSRRLKAEVPGLKVLALVHGHELNAARQETDISGADAVCGLLDLPMHLEETVRELLDRSVPEVEKSLSEPALTLQDRIRAEASAFDFTALLDGVSAEPAAEKPAPESPFRPGPEFPAAPPANAAFGGPASRTPGRGLKPVLYALLGIAAVAIPVLLMNPGSLQSAGGVNSGPSAPVKPDISLTARKGMPYSPLTPGERIATPRLPAPISEENSEKVFAAYGISPADAQAYVIVRLIPVGLGGTDNPANLFPTTPWFAGLKARLDKRLVELVQGNKMRVEQAESELRDNWVRASHRYYIRNYGIDDPNRAREEEDRLKWR